MKNTKEIKLMHTKIIIWQRKYTLTPKKKSEFQWESFLMSDFQLIVSYYVINWRRIYGYCHKRLYEIMVISFYG